MTRLLHARRRRANAYGPIRIAFLTPSLAPGGAERQMLILAAMLPKPRFDIRFIALSERGAWADHADALGVPVHELGLTRSVCPRHLRCAISAARALRRYVALTRQVDVVDAWLVPSFTFAGFAQPFARVPVVLAGRRSLLDLYDGKPWYRRAAAAWATRQMDAVVANSQAARREAIEREHIDPTRVVLIPNAVIPIDVEPADRDRRRMGWGFAPDDIVVGCVANYKLGKGLETLIEVAGRLRERAPKLRYVLVGEGPLRGALQAAIDHADLRSIVVLNGSVGDARHLYPTFDIAVQTSASEGLPNAVLEAASAGLPIVATAVGGTPEIIATPDDGMLIRPSDPAALEAAILRLAEDPELRRTMSRGARARASEFSATRLVDATAALYIRLLDERSSR